jgi:hypothetical protein
MASLELCTNYMSGFMGPDKLSTFVTTISNCTFLLRVVLLLWPSRDLWMVVIRESLWESSVWRVSQVLPPQGVYQFESPWHSRLWVTACRCSHLVGCLVYCWCIRGVGYGYGHDYITIMIIVFTYLWRWHESMFCWFMLVLVCRSKHSTWLKIKMAKLIKAKDQLLVAEFSVPTNP